MKKLRVFLVCSGLGHINRGYEAFFRGCFDVLRGEPILDITLFKGKGRSRNKEICLWNIPRNSNAARWFGRVMDRGGYFVEQLTFFLGLVPHILLKKPDVVYVSDVVLGNLIRLLKHSMKCRYRVLFGNGGPVVPHLLLRWDHIQQTSPQYLESALEAGVPRHRQTVLPRAVTISAKFLPVRGFAKDNLRKRLGLPRDRRIILSVGAINRSRKRMDYVIREVANVHERRPFLLLLGQRESDTQGLLDLGNSLLSKEGFCARTVAKDQVVDYYKVADVFTLASLDEGFGQVYVEALSHGLPCLVHDYDTARFVLGEMGYYGDLSQARGLVKLFASLSAKDFDPSMAIARHAYAYDRFSWDHLKSKYLDLFQQCARQGRDGSPNGLIARTVATLLSLFPMKGV